MKIEWKPICSTPSVGRSCKTVKGSDKGASKKKKSETLRFQTSQWQREKDSNPHIRSQSPLCYHYTIPLCSLDEHLLLYQRFCICQELIANFPDFFHFGAAGCFRSAFQRQSRSDGAGGKRLPRGAAGGRSAAWLFRRKENRQILRIW